MFKICVRSPGDQEDTAVDEEHLKHSSGGSWKGGWSQERRNTWAWWRTRCKIRKNNFPRNSLVVQWLGLSAFTAEGPGSIPGWEMKIPQAVWWGQPKTKRMTPYSLAWVKNDSVREKNTKGVGLGEKRSILLWQYWFRWVWRGSGPQTEGKQFGRLVLILDDWE